jgi:hypothetical protein
MTMMRAASKSARVAHASEEESADDPSAGDA